MARASTAHRHYPSGGYIPRHHYPFGAYILNLLGVMLVMLSLDCVFLHGSTAAA